MKYKFLAVLTIAGVAASAITTSKTTPSAWDNAYRGTPSQIEETHTTGEELEALSKASNSLRRNLKVLDLKRSDLTRIPPLTNLSLQVLAIDNDGAMTINPGDLPSTLKTLALTNNGMKFSKPGVEVISYKDWVQSRNYR